MEKQWTGKQSTQPWVKRSVGLLPRPLFSTVYPWFPDFIFPRPCILRTVWYWDVD